jgi:sugar phosphate isomerase/epimerase
VEISTSLNIFTRRPQDEAFARATAAGFRTFDFNYCDRVRTLRELNDDEERAWAEGVREAAERVGVRLFQMHAPIYNAFAPGEESEALTRLAVRSMRTAAVLGVQWVVIHPGALPGDWSAAHRTELKARNVAFLRRLLDAGEPNGVGLAIENCTDRAASRDNAAGVVRDKGQMGAYPEELLELIEACGTPLLGVCWDTGHAEVQGLDQAAALRLLGSHLKVTHIHDNDGRSDQHLLPFNGRIAWEPLMRALHDIDYRGSFSLEVHNAFHRLPEELKDTQLRFAREICAYLVGQAA